MLPPDQFPFIPQPPSALHLAGNLAGYRRENFFTTSPGVAMTGGERSNSCEARPSWRWSVPDRCSSLESSERPSGNAVSATTKESVKPQVKKVTSHKYQG